MPENTLLELSGIDLGDYSVRGLQLQLSPLDSGELAYDTNGVLHDLTLERFRKYQLTISCTDQEAPALTDVWRGKEVTVTCLPVNLMGVSSGDTDDSQLILDCMVVSFNVNPDEWNASVAWQIELLQK